MTEVKFVGGGKGHKHSYGKMEEDVQKYHDIECRNLDHLQHGDHVHTDHLQHSDHVHTSPLSTDRRLADPLKKVKCCTEEHICEGETISFQPHQSSSPVRKHPSPVTNEKGYSSESHCKTLKRVGKTLKNERRHHPHSDALGGAQVEICKNTVTRGIINKTRLMPKAKGKSLEEQVMGRDQDQFPEVATDVEREIASALGPGPQDEILSSSFKLNVTREDMQTLQKGQQLNDEIINFYISLLMEKSKSPGFPALHTFGTYFFLHQTEGWRIQGSKTVDTNCEHL